MDKLMTKKFMRRNNAQYYPAESPKIYGVASIIKQ